MTEKSASQQIDDIIKNYGGWKGQTIAQIRAAVLAADSDIIEEIKWKMPTRPEGLPVWSYNGILCRVETFKNDLKLVFSQGAQIDDPKKLFNARLMSKTERAIEFHDGDPVDATAITTLTKQAVQFNQNKKKAS